MVAHYLCNMPLGDFERRPEETAFLGLYNNACPQWGPTGGPPFMVLEPEPDGPHRGERAKVVKTGIVPEGWLLAGWQGLVPRHQRG
jgi:hypothetical protein